MTDQQALLLRQQEARWNDPATQRGAHARMERARVRLRQVQPKADVQLRGLQRAPRFRQRLLWLREAADTAGSAIAPSAACKAGCSACCYQPVMLTQAEAQVIADETGAKLAQPAQWRYEPGTEFDGQPCPFLKDRRCSIYKHRPMACRLLFNLDVDDLLCRIIPGAPTKVPYADLRQFNELLLRIHDGSTFGHMADLRDFFPGGLR